jgi:hypothetical protein
LGEEAEDDTHVQLDEASQSGLNSGEQKSSGAELERVSSISGSRGQNWDEFGENDEPCNDGGDS